MSETIERFPLFPLGLVLLPGETIPLHIFEERYKTMVEHCLEEQTPFGIVWMHDDELVGVGCTAEVSEVLERSDDGRLNIVVTGIGPFSLLRRVDDMPYPAGDVELLEDDPGEPDADAVALAGRAYSDLVQRVTDERPEAEQLADLDAYGMAATIEFPPDAKQELLEQRVETERLQRLAALCVRALERVDRTSEAAERAQTNGKVHH